MYALENGKVRPIESQVAVMYTACHLSEESLSSVKFSYIISRPINNFDSNSGIEYVFKVIELHSIDQVVLKGHFRL